MAGRLSAATTATHYRSLQQFWKWLLDGEIERSPMERMSPPTCSPCHLEIKNKGGMMVVEVSPGAVVSAVRLVLGALPRPGGLVHRTRALARHGVKSAVGHASANRDARAYPSHHVGPGECPATEASAGSSAEGDRGRATARTAPVHPGWGGVIAALVGLLIAVIAGRLRR